MSVTETGDRAKYQLKNYLTNFELVGATYYNESMSVYSQSQQQLDRLSMTQLEQLHEALLSFTDLEELSAWLDRNLEQLTDEA